MSHELWLRIGTPNSAVEISHNEWVMSHIGMCHVTRMNEWHHTCKWVTNSDIELVRPTAPPRYHIMNESCHTYKWVMSHMNEWRQAFNGVTNSDLAPARPTAPLRYQNMNGSCYIYEWVISHICIRHITRVNDSRTLTSHQHAQQRRRDIKLWMDRVTHMNETSHIYTYAISHI